MRVPSGYVTRAQAAGTPYRNVRETWLGNSFQPDLNSDFTSGLYSPDVEDLEVYKSPVVECAWDKVSIVSLNKRYMWKPIK